MEFFALLYLPVIALLVWSAWRGNQTERLVFFLNLMALWASAIWLFGYSALIVPALGLAVGALGLIVIVTAGDSLFARPAKPGGQAPAHSTA